MAIYIINGGWYYGGFPFNSGYIHIFIITVVIKQWDYNNDDPFHQGISGNPYDH